MKAFHSIVHFLRENYSSLAMALVALAGLWCNAFNHSAPLREGTWKCLVDTTTFLQRSDTLVCDIAIASERRSQLLQVALQEETNTQNSLLAIDSTRIQSRGFYVIILAALFTVVFLPSAEKNGQSGRILGIAIAVVLMMYISDVSSCDILNDRVPLGGRHLEAVHSLLAIPPADVALYTLDYRRTTSDEEVRTHFFSRLLGKAKRALAPNLEQVIFYMFPLFILARESKGNKKQRSRGALTSLHR